MALKKSTFYHFFLLLFISIVLSSCNNAQTSSSDSKKLISQSIDLKSFSSMEIAGYANVDVRYAKKQSVTVETTKEILAILKLEVADSKLSLSFRDNIIRNSKSGDIKILIETPTPIESYSIEGTAKINVNGLPQKNLSLSIAGAANFNSTDIEIENVSINIAGTANCSVWAKNTLNVSIAGVGKVVYKGQPSINKDIQGVGSVKSEN